MLAIGFYFVNLKGVFDIEEINRLVFGIDGYQLICRCNP